MSDLRSNYPTTIDELKQIPEYQDMTIDDKRKIARYQQLVEKNDLTASEQSELETLISELRDKMISSEDWNNVVGAIINLETYFKDNVLLDVDAKVDEINNASAAAKAEMQKAANDAKTYINNTKDSAVTEIASNKNNAVQTINNGLANANALFEQMHTIENNFAEQLPVLNDCMDRLDNAQPKIQELQEASDAVQDDLATIKATGNTEIIIQGTDWVLNGDIYEKEITHDLYSENLHITAKDTTTKSACTIGWQILDKTRILLKSDVAISMSLVINASFYKPLITSEVDEGEIVRARMGYESLDRKIMAMDNEISQRIAYENFIGNTIN